MVLEPDGVGPPKCVFYVKYDDEFSHDKGPECNGCLVPIKEYYCDAKHIMSILDFICNEDTMELDVINMAQVHRCRVCKERRRLRIQTTIYERTLLKMTICDGEDKRKDAIRSRSEYKDVEGKLIPHDKLIEMQQTRPNPITMAAVVSEVILAAAAALLQTAEAGCNALVALALRATVAARTKELLEYSMEGEELRDDREFRSCGMEALQIPVTIAPEMEITVGGGGARQAMDHLFTPTSLQLPARLFTTETPRVHSAGIFGACVGRNSPVTASSNRSYGADYTVAQQTQPTRTIGQQFSSGRDSAAPRLTARIRQIWCGRLEEDDVIDEVDHELDEARLDPSSFPAIWRATGFDHIRGYRTTLPHPIDRWNCCSLLPITASKLPFDPSCTPARYCSPLPSRLYPSPVHYKLDGLDRVPLKLRVWQYDEVSHTYRHPFPSEPSVPDLPPLEGGSLCFDLREYTDEQIFCEEGNNFVTDRISYTLQHRISRYASMRHFEVFSLTALNTFKRCLLQRKYDMLAQMDPFCPDFPRRPRHWISPPHIANYLIGEPVANRFAVIFTEKGAQHRGLYDIGGFLVQDGMLSQRAEEWLQRVELLAVDTRAWHEAIPPMDRDDFMRHCKAVRRADGAAPERPLDDDYNREEGYYVPFPFRYIRLAPENDRYDPKDPYRSVELPIDAIFSRVPVNHFTFSEPEPFPKNGVPVQPKKKRRFLKKMTSCKRTSQKNGPRPKKDLIWMRGQPEMVLEWTARTEWMAKFHDWPMERVPLTVKLDLSTQAQARNMREERNIMETALELDHNTELHYKSEDERNGTSGRAVPSAPVLEEYESDYEEHCSNPTSGEEMTSSTWCNDDSDDSDDDLVEELSALLVTEHPPPYVSVENVQLLRRPPEERKDPLKRTEGGGIAKEASSTSQTERLREEERIRRQADRVMESMTDLEKKQMLRNAFILNQAPQALQPAYQPAPSRMPQIPMAMDGPSTSRTEEATREREDERRRRDEYHPRYVSVETVQPLWRPPVGTKREEKDPLRRTQPGPVAKDAPSTSQVDRWREPEMNDEDLYLCNRYQTSFAEQQGIYRQSRGKPRPTYQDPMDRPSTSRTPEETARLRDDEKKRREKEQRQLMTRTVSRHTPGNEWLRTPGLQKSIQEEKKKEAGPRVKRKRIEMEDGHHFDAQPAPQTLQQSIAEEEFSPCDLRRCGSTNPFPHTHYFFAERKAEVMASVDEKNGREWASWEAFKDSVRPEDNPYRSDNPQKELKSALQRGQEVVKNRAQERRSAEENYLQYEKYMEESRVVIEKEGGIEELQSEEQQSTRLKKERIKWMRRNVPESIYIERASDKPWDFPIKLVDLFDTYMSRLFQEDHDWDSEKTFLARLFMEARVEHFWRPSEETDEDRTAQWDSKLEEFRRRRSRQKQLSAQDNDESTDSSDSDDPDEIPDDDWDWDKKDKDREEKRRRMQWLLSRPALARQKQPLAQRKRHDDEESTESSDPDDQDYHEEDPEEDAEEDPEDPEYQEEDPDDECMRTPDLRMCMQEEKKKQGKRMRMEEVTSAASTSRPMPPTGPKRTRPRHLSFSLQAPSAIKPIRSAVADEMLSSAPIPDTPKPFRVTITPPSSAVPRVAVKRPHSSLLAAPKKVVRRVRAMYYYRARRVKLMGRATARNEEERARWERFRVSLRPEQNPYPSDDPQQELTRAVSRAQQVVENRARFRISTEEEYLRDERSVEEKRARWRRADAESTRQLSARLERDRERWMRSRVPKSIVPSLDEVSTHPWLHPDKLVKFYQGYLEQIRRMIYDAYTAVHGSNTEAMKAEWEFEQIFLVRQYHADLTEYFWRNTGESTESRCARWDAARQLYHLHNPKKPSQRRRQDDEESTASSDSDDSDPGDSGAVPVIQNSDEDQDNPENDTEGEAAKRRSDKMWKDYDRYNLKDALANDEEEEEDDDDGLPDIADRASPGSPDPNRVWSPEPPLFVVENAYQEDPRGPPSESHPTAGRESTHWPAAQTTPRRPVRQQDMGIAEEKETEGVEGEEHQMDEEEGTETKARRLKSEMVEDGGVLPADPQAVRRCQRCFRSFLTLPSSGSKHSRYFSAF